MNITDEMIDRLATLSRLRFNGEEKIAIQKDLNKMLDFIGQLEEIEVSQTQPLIHVTHHIHELRKDIVIPNLPVQEALKNAPDHDTDYFRVPRVLEK
ncbi:MAG: Asp-tRNA(Asn)/Glu-tRNA(Gln) amidotransferase subunit GatC [Sphingobacteriia bacterium]|jgi:aspartyl-tRNA(Asn)/glutamyl-tRNA(Gln) amidotransferase subunit C|nr:Asp-tRNA(Asn)/Glu-tRNA(Gln) amidotransferase subunit GatC [Sphingobacteriia bacterium]